MVIAVPATPSMRLFFLQDMASQVESIAGKKIIVLKGRDAISSIIHKFVKHPEQYTQKRLPEYTEKLYFQIKGGFKQSDDANYDELAICLRRYMLRELTRAIAFHIALLDMTWFKAADSVCELYQLKLTIEHDTMLRYFQRYHMYHLGRHREAFYEVFRRRKAIAEKTS